MRIHTEAAMASSKSNTDQMNSSRPSETGTKTNVPTRNIVVEVSGSRFCIVPSLFKHIENLPWKKKKNNSLKLNANPDVFESVLQFFLSKKLPDPSTLSSRRAKTLIEFVSPLDPVAVKPLVNYLQTFVENKAATEKNSFVRRLSTISSPFVARSVRSKGSKPSTSDVEPTSDQAVVQTSSASVKEPQNSERPPIFRSNSGTNVPPARASASSIPTHIEHPMTQIVSVCSMDESSVSKLSIQSSSSILTATQLTTPQNENTIEVSGHASVASGQSQNPFDQFCQPNTTPMIQPLYSQQRQGFAEENPFSTIMEYRGEYPKVVESRQPTSSKFSNENHRQFQPQTLVLGNTTTPATTPFTQTQNLASSASPDGRESDIAATVKNSSENHRSATKMLKKYAGNVSSSVSKNLFRKQDKMSHAEWCASASEYIV